MTGDDLWIVIPNWGKFQHYSDRTPPWIKLYTELNSSDAWLGLTVAERGLLVTVWLEFARSSGQLKAGHVQTLCRGSAREKHFTSLNHAGFIQLSASKPSRVRSREVLALQEPKRAGARGGASARARAQEKEPEPLRDPEALTKLRALAGQIGQRP